MERISKFNSIFWRMDIQAERDVYGAGFHINLVTGFFKFPV